MGKPKLAIVRGKFLNAYEMQMYEPLVDRYDITAFGSLSCYHDRFAFPVMKLPSPMDLSCGAGSRFARPILNRLFVDAHYLLGLEAKLSGFDIIHCAETYFHYTQQSLNARRKAKVVATVLENIPFNNEGIWGRRGFKARARRELDHIVALTHKTKAALLIEGADPDKITVIPHFIDTKRFSPVVRRKDPRQLTILFAGRLEKYKGVYDVLSAAEMLLGDRELGSYTMKVLLVGDGSERERIKKTPNISIRQASYDEMPNVYAEADIFVAPSLPAPTWEEQYCTVILEAQAMGLPIVTTKTGGIPENIGDAGIIVEPGDVDGIAKAIKRFILEPKLRALYAKKARRRAETVHDISIGANKLDLLYQRLL